MPRPLPLLPNASPVLSLAERTSPTSVRLSLTDRCDLACVYCRPSRSDGYLDERLDLRAWRTLLEGLFRGGISRVRITGGEPLLHKDVVSFVQLVRELGGQAIDLALTTNATQLERLAEPLRRAGLQRLNISLDTLEEERFAQMTRGGNLASVLRGIEAAEAAGFQGTKLNTVVLTENLVEVPAIADWAWAHRLTPRFLELMAIGEGAVVRNQYVEYARIREALGARVKGDAPEREPNRGPAKYLRSNTFPGARVGFITGHSDTYCKGCDRLRVAANGDLRPCLATNDGVPSGDAARAGDVAGVETNLRQAWAKKPDGETFRGCSEPSAAAVSIRAIGG